MEFLLIILTIIFGITAFILLCLYTLSIVFELEKICTKRKILKHFIENFAMYDIECYLSQENLETVYIMNAACDVTVNESENGENVKLILIKYSKFNMDFNVYIRSCKIDLTTPFLFHFFLKRKAKKLLLEIGDFERI